MSTKMAVTPENIMQLGFGFTGSKALLSAIELGVFTELSTAPLNGEQLRERLKLHPRSFRDFFDTLVALGMLNREGDMYSNMPETEQYLVKGKLTYIGQHQIGNLRYLRVNYTTGDAAGQNMTGKATFAACAWIKQNYPGEGHFLGFARYDEIFAKQVRALGQSGDVAIALSTRLTSVAGSRSRFSAIVFSTE